MYALKLNDMRSPKIEMAEIVAVGPTEESLIDWATNQEGDPWTDGQWAKHFRKGSPLEWCNKPTPSLGTGIFELGTEDSWAENARLNFRNLVANVPNKVGL